LAILTLELAIASVLDVVDDAFIFGLFIYLFYNSKGKKKCLLFVVLFQDNQENKRA